MWRDDDEGAGYAVRTGVDGRLTGGFNLYKRVHHEAPRFPRSCGYNVYYDKRDAIANSETVPRYYRRRIRATMPGRPWRDKKMQPPTFTPGRRIFRRHIRAPGCSSSSLAPAPALRLDGGHWTRRPCPRRDLVW